MADPVFVDCPEDTWTLVAEKVATGLIHRKENIPHYLQTYRDTGELAPTDNGEEGIPIFVDSITAVISAASDIDVYIMAKGRDGRVRVDLPGE